MRIDSGLQTQTINISNIPDILSKLNIGDVVRAQILEITANELMLQLFDGSKLNASALTSVPAKAGDYIDFVIKDKNNGQVFLETVKGDDFKTKDDIEDFKKQLQSIDIKPDEKNMVIAKELSSNNIPISKDIVTKIADLISNIKNLTPEKAVFMASNEISPVEKNLIALKQLTDGSLKVGSQIDELYKLLESTEDTPAIKTIESKLSIALTRPTADSSKPLADALMSKSEEAPAALLKTTGPAVSKIVNLVNEEISNIKEPELKSFIDNTKLQTKAVEFVYDNLELLNKSGEENITKITSSFLNSEAAGYGKLQDKEQNILTSAISEIVKKLIKSDLSENSKIINVRPDEGIKQKAVLQSFFKDLFVKVESDNLKNDLNVKTNYKDLQQKLENLKEAVSSTNIASKEEILNKIDLIDNSVRFINEINNHSNYYQIPISVGDKNSTGELYVLKRDPKKKKLNPEDFTMFLSLNTENIGQIDSLISVNKKNLSINLRVEDQRIIDYVKENYKDLYERMSDKGFKIVDIRYRISDLSANIVNIKKFIGKELNKNISIDYKI